MRYTITYKESDQMFHMDGKSEMFVGQHLETIGKKEKIKDMDDAISEGHMLAILCENNVQVDLLEEDGSPVDY